jgi:hypothetical protein
MLEIPLVMSEHFDEETNEFISDTVVLRLEHSLVALSKWEEIWEVPFLTDKEHTDEQIRSYIECMSIDGELTPERFAKLDETHYGLVNEYINKKATATWFSEVQPEAKSGETITSELVYYWMSSAGIDWQAQHWNLNRLFALIKIFGVKNSEPKPMSRAEQIQRQRDLNAQRRAQLGTKG